MDKLEFGGPAWTDALHTTIERAWLAARAAADIAPFSVSERYIDPPAHLVPAAGELGWHCFCEGDKVTWVDGPSDSVDLCIETDYASVLPLARLVYGDDLQAQAERDHLMGTLVKEGKLRVTGDISKRPDFLEGVHDEMARITA